MTTDPRFPEFVSLACHDLRTPLATVAGFAATLQRIGTLDQQGARYVALIEAAAGQLAAIIDDLAVAASIQAGRWEPALAEVDTLQLANDAAGAMPDGRARADGAGAPARVDAGAVTRSLTAMASAAVRHGGLAQIVLHAEGTRITLAPIGREAAAVAAGEDLRDLGACTGRFLVEALGGAVEAGAEAVVVSLPAT